MTTGYQTEATDVSDQQGGDDDRADANSTPQPPAVHMRYDTFEAAKEYYLEYSLSKGFSIIIDWSRKDDDGGYLKVYFTCIKAGRNCEPKEDTQNPKSVVKKRNRNTVTRTARHMCTLRR